LEILFLIKCENMSISSQFAIFAPKNEYCDEINSAILLTLICYQGK